MDEQNITHLGAYDAARQKRAARSAVTSDLTIHPVPDPLAKNGKSQRLPRTVSTAQTTRDTERGDESVHALARP